MRTVFLVCMAALALMTGEAWAADIAAGKTLTDARCAQCHMPADWAGETTKSLESLLRDVSSGRIKHGKAQVQLNDADIANIAAYWLSNPKNTSKKK